MKIELEKLKYELDEKEIEQIKRIEEITDVDYEIIGNYIPLDSFVCMTKDMLYEYNRLKEKLEDMEKDMNDNYEPIHYDPYEYRGVSVHDFC